MAYRNKFALSASEFVPTELRTYPLANWFRPEQISGRNKSAVTPVLVPILRANENAWKMSPRRQNVYWCMIADVSTVVVVTVISFESKTSKPSLDIRRYRKCDFGSVECSSCSRLWYTP